MSESTQKATVDNKGILLSAEEIAAVDQTRRLAAEGHKMTDPNGVKGGKAMPTEVRKANSPMEGGATAVAEKPAAAPAKAPAAPAAPKTTLRDMKIGAKDGNQELVDKRADGNVQLWKSTTGKFGVVKIVNNKYVTVLPCRSDEKTARETYEKTSVN